MYIQQTKFGARCRAWNMAPYNHEAPPSIQLRLDDDLNLPATLNDSFVIENKKDILGYVVCVQFRCTLPSNFKLYLNLSLYISVGSHAI